MRCDDALVAVSLRADGEWPDAALDGLDRHVATCGRCRTFDEDVHRLRSALRVEPIVRAPDIASAVIGQLRGEEAQAEEQARTEEEARAESPVTTLATTPAERTRPEGPAAPPRAVPAASPRRHRTLVAAAVAAVAGMVAGATFVGLGGSPRSPAAAEIPERILAAQHRITALDSRLTITEAGTGVGDDERTFAARLSYRAPETLSLTVDETTPGIARRDRASGGLIVDGDGWWQSIARRCTPAEGRVRCPTGPVAWSRSVSGREPFSDAAPVPLELVSPVDSFASAAAPPAAGARTIAGRSALGVTVSAAQVDPLLSGLGAAVALTPVHPTDPVELWLDADRLVPLALTVRAGDGADRSRWAAAVGAPDRPGAVVLRVETGEVAINRSDRGSPTERGGVPGAAEDRATVRANAGFRPAPADDPVLAAVPEPVDLPAGLRPYRSGVVTTTPDGPAVGVRSWSDGRAWLTVRATADWRGVRLFGDLGPDVVPVDLGAAGVAHASSDGRRVAIHTARLDVVVAGSLPSDDLRAVATGLGLVGRPLPPQWAEAATATLAEAADRVPGLLTFRRADGFAVEPAIRIDGDIVTEVRAGPGARAVALTQRPATALPPPSAGDETGVTVRGAAGRYSAERGELEWVEDGRAVSLRAGSLGLSELLALAERLEPA
jgi:hypothetical protein